MIVIQGADATTFETLVATSRPRIIRLCTAIVGDAEIAEDLTQEVLLEAWRHRHKIYDVAGAAWWLDGIARNVCRRYLRQRGRDTARYVALPEDTEQETAELLTDNDTLDVELDREAVVDLLDRALALLPETTRATLLSRFVEDTPLAEMAAQLGIKEGTVAVHLHRGKMALRRVLTSELHNDYTPFAESNRELSQWCPHCGNHRLRLGILSHSPLPALYCPRCTGEVGQFMVVSPSVPTRPTSRYWRTLAATLQAIGQGDRANLQAGHVGCNHCHNPMSVSIAPVRDIPAPLHDQILAFTPHNGVRILFYRCATCQCGGWAYATEPGLYTVEGLRFWHQHKRIRSLPETPFTTNKGTFYKQTLVTVKGNARLEMVFTPTLELLQAKVIHTDGTEAA